MKLKSKVIGTVVTIGLSGLLNYILSIVLTPVTAVATSNQLNDTVSSYFCARLVRDGAIGWSLFIVTVLILLSIWWESSKETNGK